MELRTLARYPFLPQVRDFLKDFSLDELINSDKYELERIAGFERIRAALSGEEYRLPPPINDAAMQSRILSFVVARLILIGMGDLIVTRRFANVERDRLESTLLQFPEDIDILANAFSIRYKKIDERFANFKINVIDYIKQAKKFSTEEFRLVYKDLDRGWLTVTREQFIKIIREAFVDYFTEDIEKQAHQDILQKAFRREIEELSAIKDEYLSKYTSVDFGEVNADAFPPCMKVTISKIKDGINVSHEARFSLVAFLHKIGMSNEEILKIFSAVPDFRKDITEYQVKHITGEISGKEYSVPKCATLRSFGICVRDTAKDSLCYQKWMSHPLLYYKIKNNKLRENATQQQTSESQ